MKEREKRFLRSIAVILIIAAMISLLDGCTKKVPGSTEGETAGTVPTGQDQGVFASQPDSNPATETTTEPPAEPATETPTEPGTEASTTPATQPPTVPPITPPTIASTEPTKGPSIDPAIETVQGIVTTQDLNVRGGPGTGYEKLGTLPRGTAVTIVGTFSGWHQIVYGDDTAYVSADYIELEYSVDPAAYVISRLAKYDLFPIAKSYSLARQMLPEYIMLHFSSAVVLDPQNPYNMALVRDTFLKNGVDANYIIDRDGTIYCNVPEDRLAYHAGEGAYGGDERLTDKMNRFAIGIEILAIGSQKDMAGFLTESAYAALDPALIGYTDAQYEALRALIADICQRNSIPTDKYHILGHDEYAPGKTDPGELFDWERLLA